MSEPEAKESLLRRILPFLSVAILIAALNLAWTFYSRWNSTQQVERSKASKEIEADHRIEDALGNGQVKILSFYAMPMAIRAGDHASMCFGVSNAKSMKIEPGVEPVKPTLTRCLPVSPKKTTAYTLTADDGKGHTVKQSFVLQVIR